MSLLLDDVSIVVTPNGYKAGTLYGVLPTYAESEKVTNGTFTGITQAANITGSEWTTKEGWTIGGGIASRASYSSNSYLSQNVAIVAGRRYEVKYDRTYASGGGQTNLYSEFITSGSNTTLGILTSTTVETVTVTDTFIPTYSGTMVFRVYGIADFTGTIDNVSIKEITSSDMDVTRATAATRVDEDGLVNYAEILGSDLVTNGDFSTDSDWTKGTGWTISGGTANFTPNGSFINLTQSGILTSDKNYTVEYTLSNVTAGNVRARLGTQDGTTASSDGTYTGIITSNGSDFSIRTNGAFSGSIDNVSVKEVDRDNVPRIDYTGGGCPHILAEPQRTNIITYSEDFSQSYWNKQSGVTPTYNTTETLSPDGTYNATKFIGNGSSGVLRAGISITGVVARSVYLKSVTGTVNVVLKDPNQTVTSKSLTVTTEWQRFDLTEDNTITLQGIWIDDIPVSGIYMWGAQLEEGSYATSYIPTSGSTVTRNQDVFTRDGIGSLINDSEGVLFVEMAALANDGVFRVISLSDGGTTNRVSLIYNTSSNSIRVMVVSTSTVFDTSNSVTSTLDFHKIAIKWKLNDFSVWIDGVEVATDTSGATPIGLDRIVFDVGDGSLFPFFGKVKQLQVYTTALTDVQLAALTT